MKLLIPTSSFVAGAAVVVSLVMAACSSSSNETIEQASTTSQATRESVDSSVVDSSAVESSVVDSSAVESSVVDNGEQTAAAETTLTSSVCEAAFRITFDEGAPRDRMVIENTSTATVEVLSVEIDLTASAGQIIFDTTEGGEGVEVFQDFQVEGGDAVLEAAPTAVDGGTTLELAFSSFAPGQSFTFSIDVDDQLVDSDLGQIQVTGAEIEGTVVKITATNSSPLTAVFAADNTASTTLAC